MPERRAVNVKTDRQILHVLILNHLEHHGEKAMDCIRIHTVCIHQRQCMKRTVQKTVSIHNQEWFLHRIDLPVFPVPANIAQKPPPVKPGTLTAQALHARMPRGFTGAGIKADFFAKKLLNLRCCLTLRRAIKYNSR